MELIARGGRRRLLPFLLMTVLAIAILASAAPALAALPPFSGGPIAKDCPTLIANDHSVNALRVSASGLTPDTTYYVKLRFSPTMTPSGADNRGYTWNGTTGEWIQERTVDPVSGQTDWTKFPTIKTDASGAFIPGSADWMFVKFGDTTKTGTYYLLISLSTGTSGNTANSASPIQVNVVDARTAAFNVHAGPPTGAATKRADVVTHGDTSGIPLSLTRTEPNLCDDDSNGIVDDEQPGLVKAGGFRLAAQVRQTVDARIQSVVWPAGSSGLSWSTPDVDIALGGSDTTPPSAPSGLSVTFVADTAVLNWAPATDDTGVTAYDIYRWTPAPADAGYSNPPRLIASLAGDATAFTDGGLSAGTHYLYTVRARDAATNVGPRATVATALTITASRQVVAWKAGATFTAHLTANGVAVTGRQVQLQSSASGQDGWTAVGSPIDAAGTVSTVPAQATYYRFVFAGDTEYGLAASDPVKVTPRVKLGSPTAPRTVKKGTAFAVYGSLTPQHAVGASNVKVKCYRKASSGKWVLKKTVGAKNADYRTYTRYKVRLSLKSRGSWKLVASYKATATFAATTSGGEFLRVK